MTSSAAAAGLPLSHRSRRRPSARRSSPSCTRPFNTAVTSVGALSTSSSTRTRPWRAARMSAESSHTTRTSCGPRRFRVGVRVSDATVLSRCSCWYSRSRCVACSSASISRFLPTPCPPMSSRCRSPAARSAAMSRRCATWRGMAWNRVRGTSCGAAGVATGTATPPMTSSRPPPATSRYVMVNAAPPPSTVAAVAAVASDGDRKPSGVRVRTSLSAASRGHTGSASASHSSADTAAAAARGNPSLGAAA